MGGTGTSGVPSNNTNNFEINVNVTKTGGQNEGSEDSNSNAANSEEEEDKQLGEAVKMAVIQEITEQQRPGGLLYSEKRI